MIRRFTVTGFLALCAALLFRCSEAPVSSGSGGTDLPNTKTVVGALISSDGTPSAHARVLLVASTFNTVTDSSSALLLVDTTDGDGMYRFTPSDTGEYIISAVQLEERTRAMICSVHVVNDTVLVDTATMQKPGAIRITLPAGMDTTQGYIYVPGTNISVLLTGNSGFAVLDSVPAGTIPSVNYGEADAAGVRTIRYDIPVTSENMTELRYAFWNYARSVLLNTTPTGAAISGDVTDFPVLIRLSSENFSFVQAKVHGDDIRFAKSDGTPLDYEIERWDPVAGRAEVWVRVDTIFGNNDSQNIMMYWGESGLSTDAGVFAGSESDGTKVFAAATGFQGVWHMSGATGSAVVDATVNGFHGVPRGSTLPESTQGIIGNANVFNGADFIEMPGTADGALNFPQHGTYSVSAWVNIDSLTGEYRMIASKGDKQYNLQFKAATGNWQFTEYQDTTGWDETVSGAVAGSWVYLVGVRSDLKQYLYVNGVCADSSIYNLPAFPSDTTYAERKGYRNATCNFMVGKKVDYSAWFFKGSIDEVRVSSNARSPEWIKLCYMNQKSEDMLVEFEK